MHNSSPFHTGLVLEKRYQIVRLLGQGGFGRAYLAENLNRFNEYCVLKEFAPQVQGTQALQKAAELFQREAGVLHKLKHPQIPEFRELLQTTWHGNDYLFLVQQYIEGQTYCELLNQGKRFSEAEVIDVLMALLPVLEYIHLQGVIHRDISPDNLICQRFTGQPVLIDFGGVKQVAATAVRQLTRHPIPTQLEKRGYTPEEQRQGKAYPCSDLYALAVTALVLLTGKDPLALYDNKHRTWHWQEIHVSPVFASVLKKMLAEREGDRYQTAQEVKQALQPLADHPHPAPGGTGAIAPASIAPQKGTGPRGLTPIIAVGSHFLQITRTLVVAPARKQTSQVSSSHPVSHPPASQGIQKQLFTLPLLIFQSIYSLVVKPIYFLVAKPILHLLKKLMMIVVTVLIVTGIGYWFLTALLTRLKSPVVASTCQERVITRHESLGIPATSLYPQVNDELYNRHPELNGRALTNHPEDAQLRREWCQIAEEVLDREEQSRRIQMTNSTH